MEVLLTVMRHPLSGWCFAEPLVHHPTQHPEDLLPFLVGDRLPKVLQRDLLAVACRRGGTVDLLEIDMRFLLERYAGAAGTNLPTPITTQAEV